MNNRVSPAKGRTFPSSVAALSSTRRLVVPAATIRPPACRVAAMRPAVSAESTPFGVQLVVARVGGLLGKMATRRRRRRCRQTRPTTPPTFVEELRTLTVRPHVAQNTNRRRSAIDILLTNFHLPRSTLFMPVAALARLGRIQAAYAHAVAAGFRFFSYGNACLIERH